MPKQKQQQQQQSENQPPSRATTKVLCDVVRVLSTHWRKAKIARLFVLKYK
jgi:hypothetical protein